MAADHEPQRVTLEIEAALDVDEVVLGFRDGSGELYELASFSPPATATLETGDAPDGSVSANTGGGPNPVVRD